MPFDERGFVRPEDVEALLRPNTRAVVMTHASNVIGTVQPVAEIARRCAAQGIPVILDAAQSAGQVPIDMAALGVAALAFTGHTSLYGPSGIGGLVAMPGLELETSRFGGTGMDSASLEHSRAWPLRLEAGTLNLLGVIGLGLGLAYVAAEGVAAIRAREMALMTRGSGWVPRRSGPSIAGARVRWTHARPIGAKLEASHPAAHTPGVPS